MNKNRTTTYFKYAIGEILLVVIGILIALQINNWNEERKERARAIHYLINLKTDLHNEVENNEYFAISRFEAAKMCSFLLNTEAPQNIQEVKEYTDNYEKVFAWKGFVPINNTFKELLSSGNLSLIKNNSVKNGLLELDKLYAKISITEHHMRREYEEYLYDIHVKNTSAIEFFDNTTPKYGLLNRLDINDIPEVKHDKLVQDAQWQSNNPIFNNGLKLALMNNSHLAGMHKELVQYINTLLNYIDEEIKQ